MKSILAFDIETIPDINGIRVVYNLPDDLSDDDILEFALHEARVKNGNEFMPLHLQKIICISCFMKFSNGKIKLGTIEKSIEDEKQIISSFFNIIDKYSPILVSWNGSGFDLPVLNYRSLFHGVTAVQYWNTGISSEGGDNIDFRYNNYINRYHFRHIDLMDLLSLYQFHARCSLDDIAKLCNLPGKIGIGGSNIWSEYKKGNIAEIREYCEIDVLNTYLIYLRFDLFRGLISFVEYNQQIDNIYNYLTTYDNKKHWIEFCNNWKK